MVLARFSVFPRSRDAAEASPLRGRGGCTVRPWLSCRVHGPASLWNINMTRNIISHDSRRRGNTKYYSAEAPAGQSTTPVAPVGCILLLAAARRTCGGHEIAMINWLSRVTTRPQKVRERSLAHERLAIPQLPLDDRTIPTSASPRNSTALFASVICAGCDLSLVFSESSFGKGY